MARPKDSGIKVPRIPIRSVGTVFEKRGNPIGEPRRTILSPSRLSDAEIVADKVRAYLGLSTERHLDRIIEDLGNPELDAFTVAEMAPKRHEMGPDKPIKEHSNEPSESRRRAAALLAMRRNMRSANPLVDLPDKGMNGTEVRAKEYFKEQERISTAVEKQKEKDRFK